MNTGKYYATTTNMRYDQTIPGLYYFLGDNGIYLIFHAVPFKTLHLQLDKVTPVLTPMLKTFVEVLCFGLGKCSL